MIQLDPTVSVGSIAQVVSTLALLFYVGRWVGRTDQRMSTVEQRQDKLEEVVATRAEVHALHSAQSLEHASIRREMEARSSRVPG